tara:strand:- start:194 stop:505 length:312 start_codon:yes stop_codon:yes gene_type:complete
MYQNFFKNVYDPTLEEVRKMFPTYRYGTKEEWKHIYETNNVNLLDYIDFTLNKLEDVTTSYKLEDEQKAQLQRLSSGESINDETGWDAFCNILTPKQMVYVGI